MGNADSGCVRKVTTSALHRPPFPQKTSRHSWLIPIFGLAVALTAAPGFAADEQLAAEPHGDRPVLWKEYEPVYRDVMACIAGSQKERLTYSVCERTREHQGQMLWDAIKQAMLLNAAMQAPHRSAVPTLMQSSLNRNAPMALPSQLTPSNGNCTEGQDPTTPPLQKPSYEG
jgi:hypothetical protein